MALRKGISASKNNVKHVLFLAPGLQYARTVFVNLLDTLDKHIIKYTEIESPDTIVVYTDKVTLEIRHTDPVRWTNGIFEGVDAVFGKKELVEKAKEYCFHMFIDVPDCSLNKFILEVHSPNDANQGEARIKYIPDIKNAYFNDPTTIVIWDDGTKTIVKCQDGDTYSKETGLALCIAKKALGNMPNFNNVFKKWIPEEKTETASVNDCSQNTISSATSTLADEFKAAGEKLLNDIRDAFKL